MERCPKCGWFHTDECMTSGHNNSHNPAKTRTPILISAMRLLSRDIQSEDGVANAAIAEAAERLEELETSVTNLRGAMMADDSRLPLAGQRVGLYFGCDTPEVMADEIVRSSEVAKGALIQAQHVRDLLERGQYAQARAVNFHLVCALRRDVLNNNEKGQGSKNANS